MPIYRLDQELAFPDPVLAEEDGLIAIGGDLKPERLVNAYATGIFPWYSEGQPILWFSPDPRMVLFPEKLKVSKSLARVINAEKYEQRVDTCFEEVIRHCSKIERPGQEGTWITEDMVQAYIELHRIGLAHSFETFCEGQLVGGLYGVSLGKTFFGESMYHHSRDASKTAFAHLVRFAQSNDFHFIDAQIPSDHLRRLGAEEISRNTFLKKLKNALEFPTLQMAWSSIRRE